MTVPSYQFLAFALVAALIFNLVRLGWLRQAVLLTTNILFLASFAGQPALYLAFASFIAYGFVVLRLLQSGRTSFLKAWIVFTVLLFCWLKKYPFIPSSVLLHSPYFTIGLSYIFFRVMSLIIDAGQGVLTERVSLIEYLNFTLNFTSVTAGPIQRYQDYRAPPTRLSIFVLGKSAERIALGLFKVLLVSAVLHIFLDQTLASAASVASFGGRVTHAALLLSIYPVYLYFNFSGYTDFVIGCALLFGLKLPENFQRPFSSTNFLEFWSRWHISLSNWLKTYVYNPLLIAMVRRVKSTAIKPFLAVIAYLVTFFLVGAWHGQTPEFLFFGLLQGGGVSVNKLYQIVMTMKLGKQRYGALSANRAYAAICRGLTFTWFGFTLLWFWSNWGQLGDFIHWLGATSIAVGAVVVIGLATIILQQGAFIGTMVRRVAIGGTEIMSSRYVRTACTTAMIVVLFAVAVVLQAPAPEIVYKAF